MDCFTIFEACASFLSNFLPVCEMTRCQTTYVAESSSWQQNIYNFRTITSLAKEKKHSHYTSQVRDQGQKECYRHFTPKAAVQTMFLNSKLTFRLIYTKHHDERYSAKSPPIVVYCLTYVINQTGIGVCHDTVIVLEIQLRYCLKNINIIIMI